jgi:hypothetical protein
MNLDDLLEEFKDVDVSDHSRNMNPVNNQEFKESIWGSVSFFRDGEGGGEPKNTMIELVADTNLRDSWDLNSLGL